MADQSIPFPGNTTPLQTGGMAFNAPWYQFFWTLWQRTGAAAGDSIVAAGTVSYWPGELESIPAGSALCDGSAVARQGLFAPIFAVIGTKYGAGDGFTTFNLPNLIDKFIAGAGNAYALGSNGGAASVVIATANLPAHNHPVVDPGHIHSVTDPGHFHSAPVAASNVTAGVAVGGTTLGSTGVKTTGVTVDSATTGVSTGNTGGGAALAVLPPYVALYPIIKM